MALSDRDGAAFRPKLERPLTEPASAHGAGGLLPVRLESFPADWGAGPALGAGAD